MIPLATAFRASMAYVSSGAGSKAQRLEYIGLQVPGIGVVGVIVRGVGVQLRDVTQQAADLARDPSAIAAAKSGLNGTPIPSRSCRRSSSAPAARRLRWTVFAAAATTSPALDEPSVMNEAGAAACQRGSDGSASVRVGPAATTPPPSTQQKAWSADDS